MDISIGCHCHEPLLSLSLLLQLLLEELHFQLHQPLSIFDQLLAIQLNYQAKLVLKDVA